MSIQSSSQHNYMKPKHIITSRLQDLWPTMMENKDRDTLLVWIHHSQKAVCFNQREVVLFLMQTLANRAETDANILEKKERKKKIASCSCSENMPLIDFIVEKLWNVLKEVFLFWWVPRFGKLLLTWVEQRSRLYSVLVFADSSIKQWS